MARVDLAAAGLELRPLEAELAGKEIMEALAQVVRQAEAAVVLAP